jgi:hypothetical protein
MRTKACRSEVAMMGFALDPWTAGVVSLDFINDFEEFFRERVDEGGMTMVEAGGG